MNELPDQKTSRVRIQQLCALVPHLSETWRQQPLLSEAELRSLANAALPLFSQTPILDHEWTTVWPGIVFRHYHGPWLSGPVYGTGHQD